MVRDDDGDDDDDDGSHIHSDINYNNTTTFNNINARVAGANQPWLASTFASTGVDVMEIVMVPPRP